MSEPTKKEVIDWDNYIANRDKPTYTQVADTVARERITETRIRAMDVSEIVDEIHDLEDKIGRLTARGFEDLQHENAQLKEALKATQQKGQS